MFKYKLKNFIEIFLDRILDAIIPYKALSKKTFENCYCPSWLPFHYVFNQKIQRLQIRALLNKAGIQKPLQVNAWWSRGLNNFGDELLAYLLANIAGIDCTFDRRKPLIAIGSIARFANDTTTIWGSGIIRKNETISSKPTCLAVRGPLTREKFIESDIPCPAVYGDPAMLFPLFYKPKKEIITKPLIVPHFKHTNLIKKNENFDYINLHVNSIFDIEKVIDHIASAPSVITSSLHGFIFCVAYGVPVTVFKLEQQGIGGDNIKFDDFCRGVSIDPITIHHIHNEDALMKLSEQAKIYSHDWSALPLLEGLYKIHPTPTLQEFIQKHSI